VGALSDPSTAPAVPVSTRAVLSTVTPDPWATTRYFPSGVIAAPAGVPAPAGRRAGPDVAVSGTDLTSVTRGAAVVPVPVLSLSTSTDAAAGPGPPPVTANAQRPSGAATTPNGLPLVLTDVVPTACSGATLAVALEQPGAASPRSDREGGAAPAGGAVPALVAGCPAALADDVAPDVQPALAAIVTAASTPAVVRLRVAKPRPMPCSVGDGAR
jgi:hypothetical protein